MILQSGHMPSVLQQLCRLPFGYFSDKSLRAILLPTLLACCHDNPANRAVLQKEMSYQVRSLYFPIHSPSAILQVESRVEGGKFLRTLKGIIYLSGLFVNSCFSSVVCRRRWWRITSTATTADRYTSSAPSSTLSRTPGRTPSSDDSLSAASSRSRDYTRHYFSFFSFLRLILFVLGFPSLFLFPNQDIIP